MGIERCEPQNSAYGLGNVLNPIKLKSPAPQKQSEKVKGVK